MAIACRDEDDWRRLAAEIGELWTDGAPFASLSARLANQDALDERMAGWTRALDKFAVQARLRAAGVPCSAVQTPQERIDLDPDTAWLWPTVKHTAIGEVRVDGMPARFSATPWRMERGGPCPYGEHNEEVSRGASAGVVAG